MKTKIFMACATLIVSAAAVVGAKAYNHSQMSELALANIEALTKTEVNGVVVYQTMAYCHGALRLACTTVKYADDCTNAYCIVNY